MATSHKNVANVGLCTVVSAGFFWLLYFIGICISEYYYWANNDLYFVWCLLCVRGSTQTLMQLIFSLNISTS